MSLLFTRTKSNIGLNMLTIHTILIIWYVISDASAMECGRSAMAPNERIVGGWTAENRAWPWVVNLNYVNNGDDAIPTHICGGVLLHSEWVLTAAHCLDIPGKPNKFPKSPPKGWRITAGMHTRSEEERKSGRWQTSTIKRFMYHTGFHDYSVSSVNDIALIQLQKPFKYTEYVRPICLPNKRKIQPGWNDCYTAGWGTKSENSTYYSLSLQEVPIPVVNRVFCYARYPYTYVAGQHICGGDWHAGNMDTCKGDSGGPLACRLKSGTWYVAGIVSWGIGCGRKYTPGIYTNVETYERWILQVVRKFTVIPKPTQPKAYISKRVKRRRRSIGRGLDSDVIISSPYHMASSHRALFKTDTLQHMRRRLRRNAIRQTSPFFERPFAIMANELDP